MERDYHQRTFTCPIIHLIVLRDDVHQRYPWAAANLYKAFLESKDRSIERALDANAPRTPVPWAPAWAAQADRLFGHDFWPYGLEPNYVTLDAFLGYAQEQALCQRRLSPEELFAPTTLASFRI